MTQHLSSDRLSIKKVFKMKKLENKVVFVTGGNSGIGKACALQAAVEGAKVVIADLASAEHEATMQQLSKLGSEALFVLLKNA